MSRATVVHIDLPAISDNIAALRSRLADQKFMAVVKADAYGHGAVRVAQHIESDVDAIAVAFTEEAVILREAGISKPLLVLEGPHSASDLALIGKLDLWPVVHCEEQVSWCQSAGAGISHVWIKIDTGMHRLGFPPEELASVRESLQASGVQHLTAMSHLASAEHPEASLTLAQQAKWAEHAEAWEGHVSLHNSAATRLALASESDWVRVGYALYGGQVSGLETEQPLKAAMQLTSEVIALRNVPRGESVGYGGRWTAQRDSVIATIPVGYGDGYPWGASDGTPVCVNGRIAPLAGRVSMDMLTVDVTDCADTSLGSPVTLWGDEPQIDEVARHSGTIGYELMTRLTLRAPRHYHS